MRNLKRVLSLALALMMALSVMAFSGSASAAESTTIPIASDMYPDYDQTNYQEAVDIVTALEIVEGSDGNLEPDGLLTRAQATAIAARMLLGVGTAATLPNVGTVTGYTDVDGIDHWAAAYIAFCNNQGIISGVGGGKFDPNGQLTGVAFAKVILTVLGYDADKEGFKGDSWTTNIAIALANAGISVKDSEGNPIDLSKPITREQAMEMTFQALQTPLVEYPDVVNNAAAIATKNGATFVTTALAKAQTISDQRLTNTNAYTVEFAEKYFIKLTKDPDHDAFGRPGHIWRYNDIDITFGVDEAVAVYTSEVSSEKALNLSRYKFNKLSDGVPVTIDGKPSGTVTSAAAIVKDTDRVLQNLTANGVLVEVFADDENYVTDVVVINTYVGKVASVSGGSGSSARSITLSQFTANSVPNLGAALNTKFETSDFAAKDVVTYTAAWNDTTSKYDIQTVSALGDPATGRLTKWNGTAVVGTTGNSQNNFTVDGTTYKYDKNVVVVGANGTQVNGVWSFTVNESDLNVYVDKYGFAIYVAGVEGEKNYAAVIGTGTQNLYGDGANGATLLLADGSTITVNYKLKSTSAPLTGSNSVHGDYMADIVEYRVLDNGTYELNVLDNHGITGNSSAGNITFTNGKSQFTVNQAHNGTPTTLYTTSNTIFMVCTNGSNGQKIYNVYTGYNAAPSIDSGKACQSLAYVTNSYYTTQIDVVYLGYESMSGVTAANTYFAKRANAEIITDSTGSYYVLPAVVEGEVTEVKVDAAIAAPINLKDNSKTSGVFAITNVVKDSNGIITSFNTSSFDVSGVVGTVAPNGIVLGVGANGNVEDATYWAYNSSTTVYYVSKNFDQISEIDITSVGNDENDLVYANANTSNSSKTLKDVFIVEDAGSSTPSAPTGQASITTAIKAFLSASVGSTPDQVTFVVSGKTSATVAEKTVAIKEAAGIELGVPADEITVRVNGATWTVIGGDTTLTLSEQSIAKQGGVPNAVAFENMMTSDNGYSNADKAEYEALNRSGYLSSRATVTPTSPTEATISGLTWHTNLDVAVPAYGGTTDPEKTLDVIYGTGADGYTAGSDDDARQIVSAATHWAIVAVTTPDQDDWTSFLLVYSGGKIYKITRNSGTQIVTAADVTTPGHFTNQGIDYAVEAPKT